MERGARISPRHGDKRITTKQVVETGRVPSGGRNEKSRAGLGDKDERVLLLTKIHKPRRIGIARNLVADYSVLSHA